MRAGQLFQKQQRAFLKYMKKAGSMFTAVRNEVVAMHRERVGGLALPADLAPGEYRILPGPSLPLSPGHQMSVGFEQGAELKMQTQFLSRTIFLCFF